MSERALLRAGDCVRVGRREPCEVVMENPSVSKLHCYLEVEKTIDSKLKCFVKDVSANGTWVKRIKDTSSVAATNSRQAAAGAGVVRLERGRREELEVGAILLLLSPQHRDSWQCCFQLEAGNDDGEIVLCQYSVKPDEANSKLKTEASGSEEKTKDVGGGESEVAEPTEGKYVSCVATEGDGRVICGKRLSVGAGEEEAASKRVKLDCGVGSTATDRPGSLDGEDVKRKYGHFPTEGLKLELASAELEAVPEQRCPICRRLFPLTELIPHSADCQAFGSISGSSGVSECDTQEPVSGPESPGHPTLIHPPPPHALSKRMSVEHCPKCMKLFPVPELVSHWESCSPTGPVLLPSDSCTPMSTTAVTVKTDAASAYSTADSPDGPETLTTQCPVCEKYFSISDVFVHVKSCTKTVPEATGMKLRGKETAAAAAAVGERERRVYALEPYVPTSGVAAEPEMEQCIFCLKDVLLLELVSHTLSCPMREKGKCTIEEHCQHCLEVFPLDELIPHSLSCLSRAKHPPSSTGGGGDAVAASAEEPLERCMHCFRDFPLRELVNHSAKCTGDMLGSRDRFKEFLPSIHDLDPMALSVLNDTQARAVEYVIQKSKIDSECRYANLKARVERLGYTERDLERVLLWVRHEAPIIIHVQLDSVLHYLVKDTHYRNQFETRTSGGCTELRIRGSWEDKIFNSIYADSPPVDKVKYGVLNIVGDPRGVRSCYSYGDSFLQLKKVRLRTTFASADTSCGSVKLSCCEHYSNVLMEYNDNELRAILEVATHKKPFLHSSVISVYKEIQIHGPVCLSENVECIVVNSRHSGDADMGYMLEEFVRRNNCNLIWMEPEDTPTSYPAISTASLPGGVPGVFGRAGGSLAAPHTTGSYRRDLEAERTRERRRTKRRRKRRRRRRRRRDDYEEDYTDTDDEY